ncbi:hypothetical protein Afil01_41130 [Actinorhabdospora filicis]|uniref:Segregation and condensation protein B n=1 Tax=Actinorhabdospora filicis TaxID=1785913 RepID=A0A9W6SNP9_9ACTN|nr:SMC-Scp complex subunit ScpB [Actinorhabdospora filicis]GLZ79306.1 hypothetical protein Afil01_41130 [Actinorhabdospora filicis]
MADEARGSLADAVADWTPPWQRATAGEEPEGPPRDDTGGEAKGLAAEVAGWTPPWRRESGEPEASPEPVMAAPDPEPEPEMEPEPEPEIAEPVAVVDEPAEEPRDEAPPEVDDLPGTLEAILMVVDEPVGEIVLAQNLGRTKEEITAALERLSAEYTAQARGFDLRRQAGGWRFYTRDEYAPHVERFVLDGQQARLTKAALETLAVVAYKQPVTRARISGIRGVNCDGVIRTLLSRGLVEECGSEPDTGAHLYRTTVLFLEKLGINSVSELPPLAPFLPDDLDELTEGAIDG